MAHESDGAAARRKPRLPDGYEDEAAFLAEVRERYQQGLDADRENREAGLDDLRFLSGEQWDKAYEKARLEAGRPCLTINRLPQFVAQVVGDLRINRPGIRVRPAEDGDLRLAKVREGLIRAIERESDAQAVYANAGQAQVACGIGAFRVGLDYAADDVFDRDIRIKAIPNPFAVVWDPMSTEPTGRDARWCFVTEEMERKAFEAAWPDASPDELGEVAEQEGWLTRDVVRVTEYWAMKERPVTLGLTRGGEIVELGDGVAPFDLATDASGAPRIRRTVRRSACMYLVSGHAVLDGPYELPVSRLPVFKAVGWEVAVGETRRRFGLIRFAKDPQRLKNYWRSIAAETLALAPRVQWLVHETEEGDQETFRRAHEAGDLVLAWNGQVPPQRLDPPAPPGAVLQEAALSDQDIKDVTGLHDASLGARSNETSGRAILARQREGDVATYIYGDNLRASIRECGRVVNELIPVVYDTARTVRVLGEDDSPQPQRINDPTDPAAVQLVRPKNPMDPGGGVVGVGKYDIVVESGPSFTTRRVEAAESMMAFVQAVPAAGQVAADLIAKAQDWPMAERIGERLKKMMPPQVLAGEGGAPGGPPPGPPRGPPPGPPQPNPMQMQAMQMQLAERQAGLAKAEAEAKRAAAEAGLAEAKLAEASGRLEALVRERVAAALGQMGEPPAAGAGMMEEGRNG